MAGEAIVPEWGDLTTVILLYENDVIQSSEYLQLYIYISAVLLVRKASVFSGQWLIQRLTTG